MTPESWQRLGVLFNAASELRPADRRAFLERECAGDIDLLAHVLELLDHDHKSDRDGSRDGGSHRSGPYWSDSGPVLVRPTGHVKAVLSLGSGLLPTGDFEELLRQRLYVCGWILLMGSSVFLAKNVWDASLIRSGFDAILCSRLAVLLTACLVIVIVRSHPNLAIAKLRGLEWAVIGVNTWFFTLFQVDEFRSAEWGLIAADGYEGDVLSLTAESSVLRWFAFVVGYGLVIPNTWWRCARVVLIISLFPVAAILAVGFAEHTLGQLMDPLVEMVLWLAIALAIATYGSHKIGELTKQANEARRLGQYELKRLLGSGGMGEVYLAEHALLRRPCAIKVIRAEKAGDAKTLERFAREVRATAKLRQPNVVEVYDYGRTEDGRFYYVMEYLSGPTLERFIARYGPMASGRAIELLRQLCKALQKAHEVGLIHRDLKPGNVIVTCQDGQRDLAKLLDFGLVRDLGEAGFDGRLTEVGQIMGTPAYMSPEQASGGSILDARSDIYSLGCVGYFALTGRPVFDGDSMGQLIAAHLTKDPPDLTGIRSDVPHDLAAVVHRCLAKNPADRFTDVSALERTLGHCECAADWSPEAAAAWWRTTIEAGETPEQSQPASTASFSSGPQ
jgi:tRNA A-37 threonylcarbamoyl transferase component Bud32